MLCPTVCVLQKLIIIIGFAVNYIAGIRDVRDNDQLVSYNLDCVFNFTHFVIKEIMCTNKYTNSHNCLHISPLLTL